MGYVGNVHAHLPVAIVQLADREGIIEVLGIHGVDGKGGHLAHVHTLGNLVGCYAWGNLLCLGCHLIGV